jgi:hypothetical protein
MTYAEIATALGVGQDSARNLVRRKGWHRRPGNDGRARIDVPVEHLRQATERTSTPIEGPNAAPISAPTDGAIAGTTADLAISVLMKHVQRCESEIESLKRELGAASKRASERDVVAAQLAALGMTLGELRNERKYLREQADRLALALTSSPRFPWPWRGNPFRSALTRRTQIAEAEPRSAREAARDAGLLPREIDQAAQHTAARPATGSFLDPNGPPLTAAELERAVERLSIEIDSRKSSQHSSPA